MLEESQTPGETQGHWLSALCSQTASQLAECPLKISAPTLTGRSLEDSLAVFLYVQCSDQ